MLGRPPHEPTPEARERVRELTGLGATQPFIAARLNISEDTLQRHYRAELDQGVEDLNSQVAGSLFSNAKSGNVAAQIFWLKTRARWKEPREDTPQDQRIVVVIKGGLPDAED